jgi:(R,R)-butanediol dehydrogenase/meso-butanediol dehydrogenase/diacetyl reductase
MKAARSYGVKDIRVEEIELRDPKDNEVQINVKYCGICGSDIHGYFQGWALPTIPHPITGKTLPVVLGHEFSGEVVKVGKNIKGFVPGDRVAIEPLLYCGECEACRKGVFSCCEKAVGEDGSGNIIGFGEDGGFAEYVNVDSRSVYKLPDSLDYKAAALVEPTAVAVKAVHRSGLKAGQTIAIFGAGPIGLLIAIVAMQAGATDVFIVDVSEERLEIAKEIGVKYTLNPTKVDTVAEIRNITGNGVDIAYDVAGVQATLDASIDVIKKVGTVQIVAVFAEPPIIRLTDLLMKGANLLTTLCYENNYPETIRLIEQQPEIYEKIITKVIKIDDFVDEIEALHTDKSQAKVLVETR